MDRNILSRSDFPSLPSARISPSAGFRHASAPSGIARDPVRGTKSLRNSSPSPESQRPCRGTRGAVPGVSPCRWRLVDQRPKKLMNDLASIGSERWTSDAPAPRAPRRSGLVTDFRSARGRGRALPPVAHAQRAPSLRSRSGHPRSPLRRSRHAACPGEEALAGRIRPRGAAGSLPPGTPRERSCAGLEARATAPKRCHHRGDGNLDSASKRWPSSERRPAGRYRKSAGRRSTKTSTRSVHHHRGNMR